MDQSRLVERELKGKTKYQLQKLASKIRLDFENGIDTKEAMVQELIRYRAVELYDRFTVDQAKFHIDPESSRLLSKELKEHPNFTIGFDKLRKRRQASRQEHEKARTSSVAWPKPTIGALTDRVAAADGNDDWIPFQITHHDVGNRFPLASLQVGQELPGTVVGISMVDGLRVDVGAEVDAVVPVDWSKLSQPSLGATVNVTLHAVHPDKSDEDSPTCQYRFPLRATLEGSPLEENNREPLDLSGTDALAMAPGLGNSTLPQGTSSGSSKNMRPSPDQVLSWVPWSSDKFVDVPPMGGGAGQELIHEDSSEEWSEKVAKERRWLAAEEQCRQALARDLAATERAIALSSPPPISPALLGLVEVASEDADAAVHCVLPVVEGDKLTFRTVSFTDSDEFTAWREQTEEEHNRLWKGSDRLEKPDVKKRQESAEEMISIFRCHDALHIRGAIFAEEAELKEGASNYEADEWLDEVMEEMRLDYGKVLAQ